MVEQVTDLREQPVDLLGVTKAVTSAIPDNVRKAHRQLRETKKQFNLPDAHGLLVILNDLVEILKPDLVASHVQAQLGKKTPEGLPRFPHLQAAWIISEAHILPIIPGIIGAHIGILAENRHQAPTPELQATIDRLQPAWAAFNRVPHLTAPPDLQPDTISTKDFVFPPEALKRSEAWAQEYEANPYLRDLSKDDLLQKGRELLNDLGPRFLKGATPTPVEELRQRMERWAHFIEEINHRAIDLREWGPIVTADLRKQHGIPS